MENIIENNNVLMKSITTYKLNGVVKRVLYPLDIDSLKSIIEKLNNKNEKFVILGNGSNVIFRNKYYDGTVIKLTKINNIDVKNNIIYVDSGCLLSKVVDTSKKHELKGLEFSSGIPGTIGGAVYNNAGAYGKSFSDIIEEVLVLEYNCIKKLKKSDLKFGYRYSIFKENKNLIILGAKIKLKKGHAKEINELIKEYAKKRITSQPLKYPNAGSVFKNPPGLSAGKIIEELNLKNFNVNDAFISNKHANFIINKNNSTGLDIINLINYVQEKVLKEKNILLTLEQEIINWISAPYN